MDSIQVDITSTPSSPSSPLSSPTLSPSSPFSPSPPSCSSPLPFSLEVLRSFVLRDPYALQLYKLFIMRPSSTASSLSASSWTPYLVHHIDFYADFKRALEEDTEDGTAYASVNANETHKQTSKEEGEEEDIPLLHQHHGHHAMTFRDLQRRYFEDGSPCKLHLAESIIHAVRQRSCIASSTLHAEVFSDALCAVVKDLCEDEIFQSFIDSDVFAEFQEYMQIYESSPKALSSKERDTMLRLCKFFGEEIDQTDASRLAFRAQPLHVKTCKLSKKFGERVMVEHDDNVNSALDAESPYSNKDDLELGAAVKRSRSRSRRLHVFFGDQFSIEDTIFSETVRAPFVGQLEQQSEEDVAIPKQPDHVNAHRLNRFFGERVRSNSIVMSESTNSDNLSDEEDGIQIEDESDTNVDDAVSSPTPSRLAKAQRIIRFFGERMDPEKEAGAKSFADQPAHVRPLKLRKIFGSTPIASADSGSEHNSGDVDHMYDTQVERRRARKLHKFFGARVAEDEEEESEEDDEPISDEGLQLWISTCIKFFM